MLNDFTPEQKSKSIFLGLKTISDECFFHIKRDKSRSKTEYIKAKFRKFEQSKSIINIYFFTFGKSR